MRKLNDDQNQKYFDLLKKIHELCIAKNPIDIYDSVDVIGVQDLQDKVLIELYGLDELMKFTIEANINFFTVSSFLSLIPLCKKAVIMIKDLDGGVKETIEI